MTVMDEPVLPASSACTHARAYSSPAKWFHWITAGLIGIALPVGFVIKYFTTPERRS